MKTERMQGGTGDDSSRLIGTRIGAWHIQGLLGRGGMGAVYLVQRSDAGFEQYGALKLLQKDVATEDITRRFEQERQILARLEHPFISRLLDGGTTDDGAPYLVMEYVQGKPVDRWCDEQNLSIDARIALFMQICDAVQDAHRKLVIHRDLKPLNILVTEKGTPKVLDFGISKLLQPDALQEMTATQHRLLTPAYACPEQIRGEQITTATDVYALGVLLYQLLVAGRPYKITSTAPEELAQTICESTPLSPSEYIRNVLRSNPAKAKTIATLRGTSPKNLIGKLKGDLDEIVMTAIRKEPEERYDTPAALEEDLRRQSEQLPISARPDTFNYRSKKFIQRHRVWATAAAIALLALVGGLGAAIWEAREVRLAHQVAQDRFNDVRQLADALLTDVYDAVAKLPGSIEARQVVLNEALTYLEDLSATARDSAVLQAELAKAHVRIGDLQGLPTSANLGNLQGALENWRKALELRQAVLERNPDSAEPHGYLAGISRRLGLGLWTAGDSEGALKYFRQALEHGERGLALAREAKKFEHQQGLAATHVELGRFLSAHGQLDRAREHFDQALVIRRALYAAAPDVAVRAGDLISGLTARAYAIAWQDMDQAMPGFEEAVALSERALRVHPGHTVIRGIHIHALLRLAENQHYLERYTEAVDTYEQALVTAKQQTAANPRDVNAKGELALLHAKLSDTYAAMERFDAAEKQLRTSLAITNEMLKAAPDNPDLKTDLAAAFQRLGFILAGQKRLSEALAAYNDATKLTRDILARDSGNTLAARSMATLHSEMGDVTLIRFQALTDPAAQRGLLESAADHYQQSLHFWQQLIDADALYPLDNKQVDYAKAQLAMVTDEIATNDGRGSDNKRSL